MSNKSDIENLEKRIQELEQKNNNIRQTLLLLKNKENSSVENIMNSIPGFGFVKDINLNYVSANRTFCDLLKIPYDKIEGMTDFDIFPKDLAEKYIADDKKVMKSKEEFFTEEITIDENTKKRFVVATRKLPWFDEDGKVIGIYGLGFDISDLKHVEELKEAKEKAEESEKKIKIKNEEFESLNEELRQTNEELIKAKEKAEKKEQEVTVRNEEFESLNEELMQTNDELYKAKEAAEISEKLKTAFLANMSHEIRTPMNGIVNFSVLFKKPNISEEKRNYYADLVISSSNRLLNIINDILDISKLESEQINIVNVKVNLNDLLNDLFKIFYEQLEHRNISLYLHKKFTDEDCVVYSDDGRLFQVLNNLLNNAIKFTTKGSISFGYELIEDEIKFFVEDTGIGIDTEMHTKIFERFRQVELKMIDQPGGTGLGLSISQKIVNLLGGKIWVESKLGKGSTFYFTIPFNPVIEQAKNYSQDYKSLENSNKSKIIIAEDEEINYLLLEDILTEFGLEVLHAKNGQEAINLTIKNQDTKLILMDIKMPVLNGIEATKEIKSINPDLPIVAVTGYAMSSDKERAINAGCDGYISKPIDKNILLDYLKNYSLIK